MAGLVNPDIYKVCNAQVIGKHISSKQLAIYVLPEGGTKEQAIGPAQQNTQALTDEQIVQLERLGRTIETHFGHPQDIEWCLTDNNFYIVQSRPITTLFPVPQANDQENHLYISVGHQQMMTDPLKPLGLSFWLASARGHMYTAAGRLFVDVAPMLRTSAGRKGVMDTLGKSDPLIKDALLTILERGDFIPAPPTDQEAPVPGKSNPAIPPHTPMDNDPAIVAELIQHRETSIETLRQALSTKSGPEVFDFILEDLRDSKKALFDPRNMGAIMASINAAAWINEK